MFAPFAARNVFAIAPPMTSASTFSSSASSTAILSRHLRAAEHRDVRLVRRGHELAERGDLLLEQEPAAALAHELRERVDARVRAVHGAERVVDVDVAELGELLREAVVVLLFFRVEAEVLEQADLAGAQIEDDLLRRVADAVVRHVHFDAEELRERAPHGSSENSGSWPFLRPPEVAREDHARAALDRVLDGRERLADARVVGDRCPSVQRDVEVDAEEDALVLDRQISDRRDAVERSRPWRSELRATSSASSTMRFEKPHSLSYQLKTFAKLSPMTCVSVASKIDERGSPM